MALYSELPIYKHGCDLLSLALDVQTQMKRDFKRTLGEKIHVLCVDMLEAMAMANASRGTDRLEQLEVLLKHLRTATALLRVGHDKKLINPTLWAASIELLDSIGAMAGGWKKQTTAVISAAPAV
jgi:hypothetical protein